MPDEDIMGALTSLAISLVIIAVFWFGGNALYNFSQTLRVIGAANKWVLILRGGIPT